MRFAAIDIGSNAIRMLFEEVHQTKNGPLFKKLSLIRLPIRLGEDVFSSGVISASKIQKLREMAQAFNHLCSIYSIENYKATATSAVRDSQNGSEILSEIKKEFDLEVEIISGEQEAELLYECVFNTGKIEDNKTYMFVDVGGGSTEVNFYSNGNRKAWKSFNIGTLRIMENQTTLDEWSEFDEWIINNSQKFESTLAVGTGGNINKLYKLCNHKNWENLNRDELESKIDFLKNYSTEELVNDFEMKPDRADVIIPGGEIYLRAMDKANIHEMIVPKVGLADGLIRRIYQSYLK